MTDFDKRFTLGVEEEYQIIDARTRALKPHGSDLLHHVEARIDEDSGDASEGAGGGTVANELFLSQIEIGTPVCNTLGEVREQITRWRRTVIEAARQRGDSIAASGTHPFSHWADQELTPKSRYLDMAEDYQLLAREHLICGCHVHVGMGDREMAIQVMNRARGWLAPLVALAANSPFWLGQDSGYASYRTEIWRRWPMAGSPQSFASRAEYDALVRILVETGSISDETKIYWDMRPADRFKTLEFRATDVCLSVDEAVLVAGLVRGLAKTCFELAALDLERQAVWVPTRPELLRAAEWRAARYGIEGELIDVQNGTSVAASELIGNLLDFVRPASEEAGDWEEIHALATQVLQGGNGAMRQRAAYRKNGSFEDVLDLVTEETARGIT